MSVPPTRAPRRHLVLLLVVSIVVFALGLGDYGLVNGDEAVYHHIAREMAANGDWLRLEGSGRYSPADEFRNAPVHYWLRAGLIAVVGDNYWSMRALSALAAIASVLIVHRTGLLLGTPAGALAGALVHATTYGFVYVHSARTGELDAIVVALVAATTWLFLRRILHGGSWLAHHAALVALANTKLPLLVVPLVAEALVFLSWPAARRHLLSWSGWGLVAAPFGLGWHVARLLALGPYGEGLLRDLQAAATAGAGSGGAAPGARAFYYLRSALFSTFPWTLFYLPAVATIRRNAAAAPERAAWTALLAWPAAVLAMFAVIGRTNPWYLHPAWPALAVAGGAWIVRTWQGAGNPRAALAAAGAAAALTVASPQLWLEMNPFAETGKRLGLLIAGGLGMQTVLPAVAAGGVAGLALARLTGKTRLAPCLALVLVGALAAVRTALPLGHLDYVSPTERVARELALAASQARDPRLPRPVFEESWKKVSYLFADDYALCRPPRRLGPQFLVGPKGNVAFCRDIGGHLVGGMATYRFARPEREP